MKLDKFKTKVLLICLIAVLVVISLFKIFNNTELKNDDVFYYDTKLKSKNTDDEYNVKYKFTIKKDEKDKQTKANVENTTTGQKWEANVTKEGNKFVVDSTDMPKFKLEKNWIPFSNLNVVPDDDIVKKDKGNIILTDLEGYLNSIDLETSNSINSDLAKWYSTSNYGKDYAILKDIFGIISMGPVGSESVIGDRETVDGKLFGQVIYQSSNVSLEEASLTKTEGFDKPFTPKELSSISKDYNMSLIGVKVGDVKSPATSWNGFAVIKTNSNKTGVYSNFMELLKTDKSYSSPANALYDLNEQAQIKNTIWPATNGVVYTGEEEDISIFFGYNGKDVLQKAPEEVQNAYKKIILKHALNIDSSSNASNNLKNMDLNQISKGDFASIQGIWEKKDGTKISVKDKTISHELYDKAYTYGKEYDWVVGDNNTVVKFGTGTWAKALDTGTLYFVIPGGGGFVFAPKGTTIEVYNNNQEIVKYKLERDAIIERGHAADKADNIVFYKHE